MEKEKLNHRKIKAIETKERIRKCADQLFREYGIESVSVDSIVEMAGVSKGAFYVHFESKDSLAAELISAYVNEVDLDYKSYFESLSAAVSASDILTAMVDKIADTIENKIGSDRIKILYRIQLTKTIKTDAAINYNRELYKMFISIINKGIQQGEFKKEISEDTLAKHFIMAYRGLTYEWCIRYPDFDLKEQALKHFEILLMAIKK